MTRNATAEEALPRELAEARFSRLYRDHEREILRYALRRSPEPQDAADVVAETFLVAWRRLGEVPAGGEARLWLYATARRVLANHKRGSVRRTRLAERLRESCAGSSRRSRPPITRCWPCSAAWPRATASC
jgi:RNA polymerase sigma-70 factor (ECF subfamily)